MRKILLSLLAALLVLATVMSLGACAVTTEPEDPNDAQLGTEVTPGASLTPNKPKGDTVVGEMSGTQGSSDAVQTPDLDTTPATAGLQFKLSSDGTYYSVLSYEYGTEANVYIPYTYNGLPVLEIGYGAFDSTVVESVNIPKFVTKISAYAFRNSAIKTVSIPASLETISQNAFDKCAGLESFTVDAGNVTFTAIDGALVSGDTLLFGTVSGTIPTDATVTKVADFAFSGRQVTSVTVPENITSLGKGVFAGSGLTEVQLHSGITAIPDSFVDGCFMFTAITLPDTLESIGYAAFRNTSLSEIVIPGGITVVEGYTFYGCSALETVVLPDGLTTIGGSSFQGCSKLKTMTVPSSVTFIGGLAFKDCLLLTSIGLDKNSKLESLGSAAFMNCGSLQEMFLPGTMVAGYVGSYIFQGCSPDILVVRAELSGAPSGGKYADWDIYKADVVYDFKDQIVTKYALDIRYKAEAFCHDCDKTHSGYAFTQKAISGKNVNTKWECPETGHIHTYTNVLCDHCTTAAGSEQKYNIYVCSENGWKCPAIYTPKSPYYEGHPNEYHNKTVSCADCLAEHKVTVAIDGAWICPVTNNPHNVNDSAESGDETEG